MAATEVDTAMKGCVYVMKVEEGATVQSFVMSRAIIVMGNLKTIALVVLKDTLNYKDIV